MQEECPLPCPASNCMDGVQIAQRFEDYGWAIGAVRRKVMLSIEHPENNGRYATKYPDSRKEYFHIYSLRTMALPKCGLLCAHAYKALLPCKTTPPSHDKPWILQGKASPPCMTTPPLAMRHVPTLQSFHGDLSTSSNFVRVCRHCSSWLVCLEALWVTTPLLV